MTTVILLQKEETEFISNSVIRKRKVSWCYLERISTTWDDLVYLVNRCNEIGAEIIGIPMQKTIQILRERGIRI